MKLFGKEIGEIQRKIKDLRFQLSEHGMDFSLFLDEMTECLSFIEGYSERALEQKGEE